MDRLGVYIWADYSVMLLTSGRSVRNFIKCPHETRQSQPLDLVMMKTSDSTVPSCSHKLFQNYY